MLFLWIYWIAWGSRAIAPSSWNRPVCYPATAKRAMIAACIDQSPSSARWSYDPYPGSWCADSSWWCCSRSSFAGYRTALFTSYVFTKNTVISASRSTCLVLMSAIWLSLSVAVAGSPLNWRTVAGTRSLACYAISWSIAWWFWFIATS